MQLLDLLWHQLTRCIYCLLMTFKSATLKQKTKNAGIKITIQASCVYINVKTTGMYIKIIWTGCWGLQSWRNFATGSENIYINVCVYCVFDSVPSWPKSAGNFFEMQRFTTLPRGRPNKLQMCSRICPPTLSPDSKDYRNTWKWRRREG